MLLAVLFMSQSFLGHEGMWDELTSALHVVDHRHHRFGVSGPFVDVLNLHDLRRLVRRWELHKRNIRLRSDGWKCFRHLVCVCESVCG